MEEATGSVAPVLCKNNCGFYGNPSTLDMCSKCYKDHLLANPEAKDSVVSSPALVAIPAVPTAPQTPEKKEQEKKNRCFVCSKKLRLAQMFSCRCEYTFCSDHRFADKHECSFDYRAHASSELLKKNPVVAGSKLDKI